jgi:hypothetical protein
MTTNPDKAVLCLYELDEATGEATGRITFYCSDQCRQARKSDRIPEAEGTTTDAIEGTVCDNCGAVLVVSEPTTTPKPWTLDAADWPVIINQGDEAIAQINAPPYDTHEGAITDAACEARLKIARMFLFAPDMHAALLTVRALAQIDADEGDLALEALADIRQTIAPLLARID